MDWVKFLPNLSVSIHREYRTKQNKESRNSQRNPIGPPSADHPLSKFFNKIKSFSSLRMAIEYRFRNCIVTGAAGHERWPIGVPMKCKNPMQAIRQT